MSHASVLVAIPAADIELGIEAALSFQMEPFDEQGVWGADGSRWDWYQVGGRFTGKLSGYEPDDDPRNYERCRLCFGTGIRRDMVVENGCNGCSGTGTSRNFSNVPHDGDVTLKRNLNLGDLVARQTKRLQSQHPKALHDYQKQLKHKSEEQAAGFCDFLYGFNPMEKSVDELVRDATDPPSKLIAHYAFLYNRRWREGERLGMFGGRRQTECEMKAAEMDIEAAIRRCKTSNAELGSAIVTWNDPWEVWQELFFDRFIRPLADDTTLVTVDYHV